MLDNEIREQLKGVFAQLEQEIQIVYRQSKHPDQAQMMELLTQVQSTSSRITLHPSRVNVADDDEAPGFTLEINHRSVGVSFKGIPNGQEFTSFILAILNADGKGKMPDEVIIKRIKNIKGPVDLKTYIALDCENCAEAVQALNLMAILHGNFKHQIIDGNYVQAEVQSLGLQGVPSVMNGKTLIHSGRIQFIDLLSTLESTFGVEQDSSTNQSSNLGSFDVAVIGGGPAGVAAAIYSVRKGLKTVIIAEKIGGQLQETKGIENLISVVYTEGPMLAANLRKHLESYPVQVLENRRVKSIEKSVNKISLEGGECLDARSIIIATGARWRELGIPGEKEYIGRGVAFCPHCDGPYFKGKKIAVIGGGNSGVEAAIDLAGMVKEIVLLEFLDQLKADKVLVDKLLALPNVKAYTSMKTEKVVGDGQKVVGIEVQDRKTQEIKKIDLDGIFVQIGLLPNSQFLMETIELNKFGEIVVDAKGRTSVAGIYAAGDVTNSPFKQIIISMGEGAKVALAAFEDRMYAK